MLFTGSAFLTIVQSFLSVEFGQFHAPRGRDESFPLRSEHQLQAFHTFFYRTDPTFVFISDLRCGATAFLNENLFLSHFFRVPVFHFEELERLRVEGFRLHGIQDLPSEVSDQALVGPLSPLGGLARIFFGIIWVFLSGVATQLVLMCEALVAVAALKFFLVTHLLGCIDGFLRILV